MKKLYVLYRLLPGFIFCLMVFWPFAANIFFSNTELLDNRPLHEKPTRLDKNCLLYTSPSPRVVGQSAAA